MVKEGFQYNTFDRAVISLFDGRATDPEWVGFKAAQLASRAQLGFAIPRFIVIPWSFLISTRNNLFLKEGLELLAPTSDKIILRSSAASEDGTSESGAGRYLSLVTEPTTSAIERAAEEILRHANQQSEHRCSLILQEVPDVAWGGVCFTRHPLAAERPALVIEAARGSAEPVAQGVRVDASAIVERESPWEVFNHGDPEFTHVLTRRIGALALGLELLSASYQDIEWVLDTDDRLWLIQARHLTGLHDDDIEHVSSAGMNEENDHA